MVDQVKILTRGGVYLAKLNPAKQEEVGKVRPVIVLNAKRILDSVPPIVFVCPLSSRSEPEFSNLHLELPARDNLQVTSHALVEHCRAITVGRLIYPRLAQLTTNELSSILYKLQRLLGL